MIDKETAIFILNAIESLSLAILSGDYDPMELHEIQQQASINLYLLEKEWF